MSLFGFVKAPDINQGVLDFRASPGALLLDVRSAQEYREGHIPGSVNLPLREINRIDELASDKADPLFLYCLSGARSRQAEAVLRHMGYSNVRNLGGISAWHGGVEY